MTNVANVILVISSQTQGLLNAFNAKQELSKHNQAKFRALANMGDVLTKMNNHEEAIKVYQKQLALAKQGQDKVSEASAFGWLGVSHRLLKRFDKSLGFHTQVNMYVGKL